MHYSPKYHRDLQEIEEIGLILNSWSLDYWTASPTVVGFKSTPSSPNSLQIVFQYHLDVTLAVLWFGKAAGSRREPGCPCSASLRALFAPSPLFGYYRPIWPHRFFWPSFSMGHGVFGQSAFVLISVGPPRHWDEPCRPSDFALALSIDGLGTKWRLPLFLFGSPQNEAILGQQVGCAITYIVSTLSLAALLNHQWTGFLVCPVTGNHAMDLQMGWCTAANGLSTRIGPHGFI